MLKLNRGWCTSLTPTPKFELRLSEVGRMYKIWNLVYKIVQNEYKIMIYFSFSKSVLMGPVTCTLSFLIFAISGNTPVIIKTIIISKRIYEIAVKLSENSLDSRPNKKVISVRQRIFSELGRKLLFFSPTSAASLPFPRRSKRKNRSARN